MGRSMRQRLGKSSWYGMEPLLEKAEVHREWETRVD